MSLYCQALDHSGGRFSKKTYGTVTYKTRIIGTYPENNVSNAWLKQSE